jgi:hypothetical protein
MILFEIYLNGIFALKLEGDAPWPIHVNGIAGRAEAAQWVEIETWQIHLLWFLRNIEPV